jgi:DNA-binding NarL/FixJ family response regulator
MSSPNPKQPRRRLMVVDDDPVVRSMLSMSLGDEFELVAVAADGEVAIELAKTSQPDAALVDVDMPNGGGLRAVHGILQVAPQAAIVMLSVDGSEGTVRELMRAGAMAYCRKGIAPQALADSLLSSMTLRSIERDGLKTMRGPTD